jgi:hypothetical protein
MRIFREIYPKQVDLSIAILHPDALKGSLAELAFKSFPHKRSEMNAFSHLLLLV